MSDKKELDIPREKHKYIVGPSGATLKTIEKESGAKLTVPKKEDPPTAKVVVTGTSDQIKKAVKLIEKEIQHVEKEKEASTKETEKVYQKHQAEIDTIAKKREELFKEASKAFEKGDKAKAKKLSDEGHKLTEKMKKLQEKSAAEIYEKRKHIAEAHHSPALHHNGVLVDLHGLHVAESIKILDMEFSHSNTAKKEFSTNLVDKGKVVTVITGKGLHSGTQGVQIKPAIEKHLKDLKLKYKEVEGGFEVQL